MGKSLFVPHSQKQPSVEKRLRDRLGSYGLKLEGPCSDAGKAIERITGNVRRKMKSSTIRDPIAAALATLIPKNVAGGELELDVPFVLGRPGLENFRGDSAGAVACSEPTEYGGRMVRQVDMEGLTLMGLAVLRRLGVESFYSYVHFDPNSPKSKLAKIRESLSDVEIVNTPCILVPGRNSRLVTFVPPSVLPYPLPGSPTVLEVLDDEALLSISRLKLAAAYAETLMVDLSKEKPEYESEWEMRAMMVGHLLFSGLDSWPLDEAESSVIDTISMFDLGNHNLESIREVAEDKYVDFIMSPDSYVNAAASTILCDDAYKEFSYISENLFDAEGVDVTEILRDIKGHACALRMEAYMCLAVAMNQHIHPAKECEASS